MAAAALAPAAQALVATIRNECSHLLNGETEEIHVLDALVEYTQKYYRESYNDISDLCEKAKSYV
jgi:hypothetical protein